MKPCTERIYNGVIKENPTLVLMLGMCPTLAVTTSCMNGFGMGVSTLVVLVMSNLVISALRKVIPDAVRLPAYIVIVASLVTVVELLMEAYVPDIYDALGIYIPLIVVNCIILGRAEGLGFTISLSVIGLIRELLGAGTVFGMQVMPSAYKPIAIFIKAPGAFLVLAVLVIIMNSLKIKNRANAMVQGCDGCCATCAHAKEEGKEAQKLYEIISCYYH